MALQLIRLHAYPGETAVTKVGFVVPGGAFFLDFSRPLERIRWFGAQNRWFGFTVGLMVPVVHQGQRSDGYVISVHRSDPYFADVRALWKTPLPIEKNRAADNGIRWPKDRRGFRKTIPR
jgi:hypothetical protein